MTKFELLKRELQAVPRTWLVTGVAGFIGSNLLEHLLRLDQTVVGLDNFSTGTRGNLDEVRSLVSEAQWRRFRFMEGDIREPATCSLACAGVDYVLHQAALGSVPRSIDNPQNTNENNVTGTLNMLVAARDAGVARFVYASSSAVYGDHPALPKREESIGRSLSPYAVSKHVSELYANQFANHYGLDCIGLRYFNVFGPRQDPEGPYAAVIPKWVAAMIAGEKVHINGTGETSRDFCFVENVVQMNLLAATGEDPLAVNQAYNVALNARTSLNELFELLRSRLEPEYPQLANCAPVYQGFRAGDVMHSQADISKSAALLGYQPSHSIGQGLDVALGWYRRREFR
jgi:UDP-N-acetylglucosamine/UDP-N-acetylgalactosamine 4-epimerase